MATNAKMRVMLRLSDLLMTVGSYENIQDQHDQDSWANEVVGKYKAYNDDLTNLYNQVNQVKETVMSKDEAFEKSFEKFLNDICDMIENMDSPDAQDMRGNVSYYHDEVGEDSMCKCPACTAKRNGAVEAPEQTQEKWRTELAKETKMPNGVFFEIVVNNKRYNSVLELATDCETLIKQYHAQDNEEIDKAYEALIDPLVEVLTKLRRQIDSVQL